MDLLAQHYLALFKYPDGDLLKRCFSAAPSCASILDLGCASGRILAEGLAMGLQVSGIDADARMIGVADAFLKAEQTKKVALPQQQSIHLYKDDFTKMNLKSLDAAPFSCIVCAANTWTMVLDAKIRIATLKRAAEALADDGRILIWMRTDQASTDFSRRVDAETPQGPASMDLRWSEDPQSQIRTFYLDLACQGKTESHQFSTLMLNPQRAQQEFSAASLQIEAAYGNFDCTPLINSSPLQIYILRK